jgi:hypothetical protein
MLIQGNHKLGGRLIWSFSLPSARSDICSGMSSLCQEHCYSRRLEAIRPVVRTRYEANYQLSLAPNFARRVCAFLIKRKIAVVRLHVGGDFYSSEYAHKWLCVMRRLPQVRFYFYTRSWRNEAIALLLDRMATLPNCRAWYSCDHETSVPAIIPPGVRLAYLSVVPEDLPSAVAGLVFRIRRLRSQQATHMNTVRVCPAEDGVPRTQRVTCERCQLCWQPLLDASSSPGSLPLPPAPKPEEGR